MFIVGTKSIFSGSSIQLFQYNDNRGSPISLFDYWGRCCSRLSWAHGVQRQVVWTCSSHPGGACAKLMASQPCSTPVLPLPPLLRVRPPLLRVRTGPCADLDGASWCGPGWKLERCDFHRPPVRAGVPYRSWHELERKIDVRAGRKLSSVGMQVSLLGRCISPQFEESWTVFFFFFLWPPINGSGIRDLLEQWFCANYLHMLVGSETGSCWRCSNRVMLVWEITLFEMRRCIISPFVKFGGMTWFLILVLIISLKFGGMT
jgi:hypothetical protein